MTHIKPKPIPSNFAYTLFIIHLVFIASILRMSDLQPSEGWRFNSVYQISIPSSNHGQRADSNMLWLGDVRAMKYTMPSKDKHVLGEEHGTLSTHQTVPSGTKMAFSSNNLRHPGQGLILANLDNHFFKASSGVGAQREGSETDDVEKTINNCVCARLPLLQGSPLSLTAHPRGEWMVVSYLMNGRGAGMKSIELVSLRKQIS